MKKYIFASIFSLVLISAGVFIFLSQSRQVLPVEYLSPPPNPSEIVPFSINREIIYELLNRPATLEELQEKYGLKVQEEWEAPFMSAVLFHGNTQNVSVRFHFRWNIYSNRLELAHIDMPASLILPEYVGMTLEDISAIIETPLQCERETFWHVDGLEISVWGSPLSDLMGLVNVARIGSWDIWTAAEQARIAREMYGGN